MSYTMEWAGAGLIKKFSGYVSATELSTSAAATTSDPEFDAAKYVIIDFSEVTRIDLADALENVAVMRIGASLSKPCLKVAYVSQNDDIRRFADELLSDGLSCGWETEVFVSLEDAVRWASRASR